VTLYLNAGIMYLSEPDTIDLHIPTNEAIFGLLLGGEYGLSTSWTLLSQVNFYAPPFSGNRMPLLNELSLQLIFGLTYAVTPDTHMEVSFSEDLSRSAPDFTVYARVTTDWDL